MFTNVDRFADSAARRIRIGDVARFPLGRLGDAQAYNRTWEAIAFPAERSMRHCVIVRRRHDGLEKCIAQHWFVTYAL
jgi:hypothetical protein